MEGSTHGKSVGLMKWIFKASFEDAAHRTSVKGTSAVVRRERSRCYICDLVVSYLDCTARFFSGKHRLLHSTAPSSHQIQSTSEQGRVLGKLCPVFVV